MTTLPLYINGAFAASVDGDVFISHNPYDQSETARVFKASKADVDLAVQAAHAAFHSGPWRDYANADRAALLKRIAGGLRRNLSNLVRREIEDSGSTLRKATDDVMLAIRCLNHYAEMAENFQSLQEIPALSENGPCRNYLKREPIGVCAAIIPWNFPLKTAVWKIAPALATGNTIILKPAEQTPLTAHLLAEIIDQCEVPQGVVNIIQGFGPETGEALISHPLVDKISFTGSTGIGRRVMAQAAKSLKRITLECGGKSANIVLPDADHEMAVAGSIYAMFYHAGQCCEAGSRLLVPTERHDELVAALIERAQTLRLGDPREKSTDMGPLISEIQRERVLNYIQRGVEEGATLVLDGREPRGRGLERGWFVGPTIFADVTNQMAIAREEIFGPVLTVQAYRDEAELAALANDSDYGLGAGIWTAQPEHAMELAQRLRVGTVWINDYHVIDARAPFGGYKQSGLGREHGEAGLQAFTELKHIHVSDAENPSRTRRFNSLLSPEDNQPQSAK